MQRRTKQIRPLTWTPSKGDGEPDGDGEGGVWRCIEAVSPLGRMAVWSSGDNTSWTVTVGEQDETLFTDVPSQDEGTLMAEKHLRATILPWVTFPAAPDNVDDWGFRMCDLVSRAGEYHSGYMFLTALRGMVKEYAEAKGYGHISPQE